MPQPQTTLHTRCVSCRYLFFTIVHTASDDVFPFLLGGDRQILTFGFCSGSVLIGNRELPRHPWWSAHWCVYSLTRLGRRYRHCVCSSSSPSPRKHSQSDGPFRGLVWLRYNFVNGSLRHITANEANAPTRLRITVRYFDCITSQLQL